MAALLVDHEGRAWAKAFSRAAAQEHVQFWHVISPEGDEQAVVRLDESFELLAIGERQILARRTGEFGEQTLWRMANPLAGPQVAQISTRTMDRSHPER